MWGWSEIILKYLVCAWSVSQVGAEGMVGDAWCSFLLPFIAFEKRIIFSHTFTLNQSMMVPSETMKSNILGLVLAPKPCNRNGSLLCLLKTLVLYYKCTCFSQQPTVWLSSSGWILSLSFALQLDTNHVTKLTTCFNFFSKLL